MNYLFYNIYNIFVARSSASNYEIANSINDNIMFSYTVLSIPDESNIYQLTEKNYAGH